MLALALHIGAEHYAIPVKQVTEVLPLTTLKKMPLAPDYIAGLLDYRGTSIPVVDLCALLTGKPHHKVLTTRIILIKYQHNGSAPKLLGLIAERVTETVQINSDAIQSSGIRLQHAPYLSDVSKHQDNVIQLIEANALLTDEVHHMLYQEPALDKIQMA